MGPLAIWTCVMLLIVAVAVLQSATLRAVRHVWKRTKISDATFADSFFPAEQQEIAVEVRQLMARYLPVQVERILPEDRLVEDLGLSARLSRGLDLVAFVKDVENEYGIEFVEDDYLRMQTFRDVVAIIAEKRSGKARD